MNNVCFMRLDGIISQARDILINILRFLIMTATNFEFFKKLPSEHTLKS